MTEFPEKFPLTSADIAAEKYAELRRCLAASFPEIIAEDKIDIDQLRRVLGEWVEPDRERFGLTWPGSRFISDGISPAYFFFQLK